MSHDKVRYSNLTNSICSCLSVLQRGCNAFQMTRDTILFQSSPEPTLIKCIDFDPILCEFSKHVIVAINVLSYPVEKKNGCDDVLLGRL